MVNSIINREYFPKVCNKIISENKTIMYLSFPNKNKSIKPAFKSDGSINIVFFADLNSENILLPSIVRNAKTNEKYDIIVLKSKHTAFGREITANKFPKNFTIRTVYIENYMDIIENSVVKSKFRNDFYLYKELLIPFIFKEYEKILYLNTNTFINKNISELFHINTSDKEICAVNNIFSQNITETPKRKNYAEKILKIENVKNIFDTDVILFNINKINLSLYKTKIQKAFTCEYFMAPAQDIFNIIFQNNIHFLPQYWNTKYGQDEWGVSYSVQNFDTEPYILSFAGDINFFSRNILKKYANTLFDLEEEEK